MKKSIFKGMFALVFSCRLWSEISKESYKVVIFGIGECGGIS